MEFILPWGIESQQFVFETRLKRHAGGGEHKCWGMSGKIGDHAIHAV
jgi:hypothetical protein